MKSNKDIITMCYDYVKSNPKIKNSEFDLTDIVKSLKLSKEEMEEIKSRVGILYVELLQDSRFVYVNGKWGLREKYTYAEYNQKINELYNYDSSIYEQLEDSKKTDDTSLKDKLDQGIVDYTMIEEVEDLEETTFYSYDDEKEMNINGIKESLDIEIDDDSDLDIYE